MAGTTTILQLLTHLMQILIKLALEIGFAMLWEFGLRGHITPDIAMSTDASIIFAVIVILISTAEILSNVGDTINLYFAYFLALAFGFAWFNYRHIVAVNMICSFLLTYMVWSSPDGLCVANFEAYVSSMLLTILATAGCQVIGGVWVGVAIRMVPTIRKLFNFNEMP